ncbi:MAG: hypothetical protein ABIO65_02460, partial [Nitrospiria bacterium]
LVGLLLMAGCIAKDDPTEGALATDAATGVLGANESAVAPDGRGEISAFRESNRTVTNGTDAMEHKHDYWGGETRRLIGWADGLLFPIPLLPEGKPAGTAIADFDLPAPFLVYEGTDHLEFTFNQVEFVPTTTRSPGVDHPFIPLFVDYLTAVDEPGQFRPAGQAMPGQPLIIPVKPVEADMPHQTKSLWLFRVTTGEANYFAFNFTVTAVKGAAIVDWPPHPDLYAERTERLIFEGAVHGEYKGSADNLLYGTDANWVYPERIISYGTDTVTVTVEYGAWGGPGPEPAAEDFELQVNNASYIPKVGNGDPAGLHVEAASMEGKTYVFEVPVDPAGFDTPYGQKSRWSFRFAPMASATALNAGAEPWSLDYTMKIVATGRSISGEALPS